MTFSIKDFFIVSRCIPHPVKTIQRPDKEFWKA